MELIKYTECPCCHARDISFRFSARDYTVSQQEFAIWECSRCTARFTQNVPVSGEIGRYYKADSYISHTDTKKGFVNSLYHTVRKITLAGKRRLVLEHAGAQGRSLLDYGAGTGAFGAYMQSKGWEVKALEPDEETRRRAREIHKIALQPVEDLYKFTAQSFDAITLWHVLEHVHDLHATLDQIRLLLRQQGRAFIAVPNYTSYDASAYGSFWAAYDVPRHLYHFSPDAMKALLLLHKMAIVDYVPMWYDSFYVSMLSEQYRNGKSNLLGAVGTGLLSNMKALFNTTRCSSVIYVVAPC